MKPILMGSPAAAAVVAGSAGWRPSWPSAPPLAAVVPLELLLSLPQPAAMTRSGQQSGDRS